MTGSGGVAPGPRIAVIDNYDSFVYNLVQYLGSLGAEPVVFRNDRITVRQVEDMSPSGILISPGPGNPESPRYFGVCRDIILGPGREVPTMGVCLGHQGIGAAFGARVVKARRLFHGKRSEIVHDGRGLFSGLASPLVGGRYHSLAVEEASLPEVLEVSARTPDGEVMGIRHRQYKIEGIQFHPESILTPDGMKVMSNFLEMCR